MSNIKISNILDPVRTDVEGKLTLDPDIWDNPTDTEPSLKKKHSRWIMDKIYRALSEAGYSDIDSWLKVCLSGSLTTYQYSSDSDVDMSLFVDSKHFPEWSRGEMIGVMVSNLDGVYLPGTSHPLQDFVVGKDKKESDLYKPGLRSGYDLDKSEWIVPPEPSRIYDVQKEENGFYVFAMQSADKMERLIRYEPQKAIDYWHQIHKKRQREMAAGKGDASQSNVVYKFLAQRGLLPKIADISGEYIA